MKNNLPLPAIAWLVLTAACLVLLIVGLRTVLKRSGWEKKQQQKIFFITTSVIILWTAFLSLLSLKGFFADFSQLPPRPALALLIPLPFVLIITFSGKGTQLLQFIPAHWLVYMQSFRIIVEFLLFSAFLAGKLPVQMTFEERNFDVVTGLLALPVGYIITKKKFYTSKPIVALNVIGLILLLNILVIAVLSMPTSLRYFMNEPANTLVAEFPFILLPGILVPLAYSLHIFSLRKLITEKKAIQKTAMPAAA